MSFRKTLDNRTTSLASTKEGAIVPYKLDSVLSYNLPNFAERHDCINQLRLLYINHKMALVSFRLKEKSGKNPRLKLGPMKHCKRRVTMKPVVEASGRVLVPLNYTWQ